MSLPFSIGDVVEIDREKILTEPSLAEFVGQQGVVKTMGIKWVRVAFEDQPHGFVISSDKLRRVKDEDTYRF
jgi:predicted RNA-binding protein associated with RNAse of E/G family